MPLFTAHVTYASNEADCKVTMGTTNITLRHGLEGENAKLLGHAHDMANCIAMSCDNIGGNTAFLLGNRCYVIQCSLRTLCDTIPLARKDMTSEIAYLLKPRSRLDYNGESKFWAQFLVLWNSFESQSNGFIRWVNVHVGLWFLNVTYGLPAILAQTNN